MTAERKAPVYVVDPANPTDAEIAAAVQRGLADGSLITAEAFLAQVGQPEPGAPAADADDDENTLVSSVSAELAKIKRLSFVEGYQASDEEAMGILLSRFFKWDGVAIMKAAAAGLEDANFHTECALVLELARKAEEA